MSNLMFIEKIKEIYKKPTNDDGGWSYAARPKAEDSKFYELNGEWLYVVKDKAELESLRDQGSWMTSTDPNQLVSITDKDNVTKSIPMNNLVTTRLDDMSELFNEQPNFNQYIGNWDMSNITSLFRMFRQAPSFNQPIENWDTGNVTSFSGLLLGASSFNQPLNNWNTGNAEILTYCFDGSPFNHPLNKWNLSKARNAFRMFNNSPFNQDISMWDVALIYNMGEMFRNASNFNQDLSSWCVSGITNYTGFDENTPAWTLPKPNFSNPPC